MPVAAVLRSVSTPPAEPDNEGKTQFWASRSKTPCGPMLSPPLPRAERFAIESVPPLRVVPPL